MSVNDADEQTERTKIYTESVGRRLGDIDGFRLCFSNHVQTFEEKGEPLIDLVHTSYSSIKAKAIFYFLFSDIWIFKGLVFVKSEGIEK